MKILERKELSIVGNCPNCGSKLELEKSDLWWNHDLDGSASPWVTCIVCLRKFNVGSWNNIDKLL